MDAKEVCKYITELEKNYHQACSDVQEALEILQDVRSGGSVHEDRVDAWINKVPHMCSSKCVKEVLKIEGDEPLVCRTCGKECKGGPESLRKYYSGFCAECFYQL